MHSDAASTVLDDLPLLAGLPANIRDLVGRSFVPRELTFGQTIFEAGDPADAYYVIAEGTARVLAEGDDGKEVSLNVLGPGSGFGEVAILEGTRRTATVRVSSRRLKLLRLDAGVFSALADSYPTMVEAFKLTGRERQLRDFLCLHSAFAILPQDATLELIGRLEKVELEDGADAIREGDPSDALFLVEDGKLGVWRTDASGIARRIRSIHTGDFVGEMGLVRRQPRTATVRAEGAARLLRLERSDFEALMSRYGEFAKRVDERVALYDARDRADEAGSPPIRTDSGVWVPFGRNPALSEIGQPETPVITTPPRRYPCVRQIDEMDCGAACIASVCRGFGHEVSITTIRDAVGTGTDGTTLRGLIHGGTEVGLRMRAIKSSADRLDSLPLPAIIHWEGNHWIVLYAVEPQHVRVADPGRGRRKVSRAEVREHWTGYAALAEPTERLAEAPHGGLNLRWVWPFLRPYRTILLVALLLALVAAGLEMALPVFSQIIIDRVIAHHDRTLLYLLMAAMLAVIGLAVVVTISQRLLLARAATRFDAETLDFISGRLLALPIRYFESRRTGDIERRLSGMQQVRETIVQNGVAAATAATQVAMAVVIMFTYSWVLGAFYLATAPLYAALMRYSRTRMRPVFDSVEAGHGRYQSRQIDALRGITTVKAMGAEEGLRQRMALEFRALRDKLFHADVVTMVYEGIVSTVSFLVYAVFLFLASVLVLDRNLTAGQFVAFSGLVLLASGPLMLLLALWDQLQLATVLMGRLQDVIDQEPEQAGEPARPRHIPSLEGHIRLSHLGFAYPRSSEHPVLENITFEVTPGTTVGVVGRSGSGKSTLAKCVAGLLLPSSGSVFYDGHDLRDLDFRELRRRIGYVLQNAYVFDDTVWGNIAFGELEPNREKVRRAAEIANAAEFIERLPLGYETRIGDSGLTLSGGQAQRIAIARALYHQPPVLIFDEATSALDNEAERAVKKNLDRLLVGRTAFVIAHRLSTIRDADVICVLEQGRLVESGTHEELVRREGLYAYLLGQQLDA